MSNLGIPMQEQPAEPPATVRRRGRLGMLIGSALLALVLIGALLIGRALLGALSEPTYEDYEGEGTGSVVVTVSPGDSVTAIAKTLAEADVVASPQAFLAAAKGDPRATTIAPGNYELAAQMSGAAAFERILDPASRHEAKVALPEGLRIDQVVARTSEATGIPADSLWEVLRSPASGLALPAWAPVEGALRAEGFLFPATYAVDKDADALTVLQTYVERFNEAVERTGLSQAEQKVGYSPYEVLIVASLIQAEGAIDDYPKVARVIYNRLNPRTWGDTYGKLQLDATINYANEESKLNISSDQLAKDGPYNTYTREGLPPTPINSPGEEAILAALNPAPGNWLYYVTVNPDSGETRFTNSYNEFLRWKEEFQQWCENNRDRC